MITIKYKGKIVDLKDIEINWQEETYREWWGDGQDDVCGVHIEDAIAWLEKQSKETSWKPSKEEMDVLYGLAYITNKYDEHKEEVITRLYQDLKREFFNGSSYENMFPNTENDVRRRSTIQVLEYARSLDNYNQYGKADIDKNIAWLEKQGKSALETRTDNELVEEEVGLVDNLSSRWVNEFNLPEGYIFKDENGNVINAQKIVLEKKKKSAIREEQIDNAAQEYIDSDNAVLTYSDGFCEQTDHPFVRAAFKAGAEWADNDVTQDDCSKAPKLTSEDYSNGRFGYRLPAGFKAKLTERELILTPEKPEYPKSLLDCENVLNGVRKDRKKLLHKFNELLICRDAYWKIAGEEMGLGKPWEPDWNNVSDKYCIYFVSGYAWSKECQTRQCPFAFPTAEMRDAFKENFDPDIEICKEFL